MQNDPRSLRPQAEEHRLPLKMLIYQQRRRVLMDDNELRKLLQQLRDEINSTQTVDEEGSELLRDLDADISALLNRLGENHVQVHPSFMQRLENALNHFEVIHPELTILISRLLDSLSNTGI
jgi:uncharacterized alpha-E superfamily protein